MAAPLLPQSEKQKGGGGAETDGIAEAVELAAELAGGSREPGRVAVEHVENHSQQDQSRAEQKVVGNDLLGLRPVEVDLARVGDGGKPTDSVAQSQQGCQD